MKTSSTPFALFLVCCLALVSSCKKEDADPEPTPAPVAPKTPYSLIKLSNNEYNVYEVETLSIPNQNYYAVNTMSAYNSDTMALGIIFMTPLPTEGVHSLSLMDNDARMYLETATQSGSSASGVCNVSKVNGHYKFQFHSVDIRYQTGASVNLLGVIYAP